MLNKIFNHTVMLILILGIILLGIYIDYTDGRSILADILWCIILLVLLTNNLYNKIKHRK